MPGYSPELNLGEYLKANLKAPLKPAEPVRGGAHLKRKVFSQLRSIRKQPARVRFYFKANTIRYAA